MDSAGLPKLNPPDAGLDPKRFPEAVDPPAGVSVGLPKLKFCFFPASSAGFDPKRPAPPVLALKVELEGGGPAGVVEAFPKLKRLPEPLVAGVVEPNNAGADVEGVDILSGVPNPGNAGFVVSLL